MQPRESTAPADGDLLLEVQGLAKRFGAAQALAGVALAIRRGERHALIGENGAGKSTLIKVLSGNLAADAGTMRLAGAAYRPAGPAAAAAAGVAVVHQELSIIADLTVAENVFLGAMPTRGFGRVDFARLRRETRALLDRLGLDIDPGRRAGELSVAMQQLVEIAKGVARNARLLILDEPTSSLGAPEAARLWTLAADLNARGTTIVYVTHKLDEVLANSDRVTVLRDGRSIATLDTAALDAGRLVELMVGRSIAATAVPAHRAPGAVALEVAGLSRRGAFSDVSFAVRTGEIVGFAGLVGAGRTEVMRCILGIDMADAGEVRIAGRKLRPGDPRAAIGAGIGLVPENRKEQGLFLDLSLAENMALPGAPTGPLGFLRLGAEAARARAQVRDLAIAARSVAQPVSTLSGGNQQKVVLARWLALDPKVLIVDEPTRGIDVGAKQEIYALLRRQAEAGCAIVVVSSELPEVLALSDRVIVMREGRIVGELERKDATETAVGDLALDR